MRIIYLATIMVFSCKLVFSDDINWIKKAAKQYNLPPLSDYLQDASSSKHAFLEVIKRCSAMLGSSSWALSHLNGLPDDDQHILDANKMHEDLREFSFRVHVLSIRGVELNQYDHLKNLLLENDALYCKPLWFDTLKKTLPYCPLALEVSAPLDC